MEVIGLSAHRRRSCFDRTSVLLLHQKKQMSVPDPLDPDMDTVAHGDTLELVQIVRAAPSAVFFMT
jgi:hypothetical protein